MNLVLTIARIEYDSVIVHKTEQGQSLQTDLTKSHRLVIIMKVMGGTGRKTSAHNTASVVKWSPSI